MIKLLQDKQGVYSRGMSLRGTQSLNLIAVNWAFIPLNRRFQTAEDQIHLKFYIKPDEIKKKKR